MTTRKHEIEESMRDETHACEFCMEREADSICDLCSKPVCMQCTTTVQTKGVLCPDCCCEHAAQNRKRRLKR